jgi:hypothetical protein
VEINRRRNKKKAAGLGYCDWVSPLKKLAHSNADCGLRNAEFKTLKTGWSRGQNTERKNITHKTLRMAQRSQEGYRDEFRMTNDGFILNGSEYS